MIMGVLLGASGCVAAEPFDAEVTLRAGGLPAGTMGALDVTTPRVLPYRLIHEDGGVVRETETTVSLVAGQVFIPLKAFFDIDEMGRFDIEPTGFSTHPDEGAIPNLLLMLESMPDAPIDLGSTWERSRPSDADAAKYDGMVLQQRRAYTVVDSFATAQGMVVRVEVAGSARWVHNKYSQKNTDVGVLRGDFRPESFGHVDVNMVEGVVVDAHFYSGFGLGVAQPEDLVGAPGAVQLTLCPGAGSTFIPMADTCN